MKRVATAALVAGSVVLATAGCGADPAATRAWVSPTTGSNAAPAYRASIAGEMKGMAEDISAIDLGMYLKVARLYCFWHLVNAELDYAGSRWLTESGLVIPRSAGWTFGYFHEPDMGTGERVYAVLHVNQRHSLTVGNPNDVGHRGTSPLWLGGLASPKEAIRQALAQGLPRGDRFGVEYISSSENSAQISLVSSYSQDRRLGQRHIPGVGKK
ncbi:MAG: hypothetical protein FJZ01_18870 [Candidatus Sericytochromatia bacterium]|nr:hypothetical protein [Candidatus Tanganyikabacteria bacterium]